MVVLRQGGVRMIHYIDDSGHYDNDSLGTGGETKEHQTGSTELAKEHGSHGEDHIKNHREYMTPAITPAPLFFRALQRDLTKSLEIKNQCYNAPCHLSQASSNELGWWRKHLERWNGKSSVVNQPDDTIESDASLRGWGAAKKETSTGRPWSLGEKQFHIIVWRLWHNAWQL